MAEFLEGGGGYENDLFFFPFFFSLLHFYGLRRMNTEYVQEIYVSFLSSLRVCDALIYKFWAYPHLLRFPFYLNNAKFFLYTPSLIIIINDTHISITSWWIVLVFFFIWYITYSLIFILPILKIWKIYAHGPKLRLFFL